MSNKHNLIKILNSGKELKCEICGIKNWCEKELTLHVHHIDGNKRNNDLSNLQLLCPNCHSQTDNFCAKNRKNAPKPTCKKCGAIVSKDSKSGYCIKCYRELQKAQSKCPSKEQLLLDCQTLHSCSQISKKYKVSDKTIKKWCEKYNIDIKLFAIKPYFNNRARIALKNKFSKSIYQFDLNENFIAEYSSIHDGATQTNVHASNIRRALNKKCITAGGYIWKWKYK